MSKFALVHLYTVSYREETPAILYSLVAACRILGMNSREFQEDIIRQLAGYDVRKLDKRLSGQ